jgi:error-prone DNA polymerase
VTRLEVGDRVAAQVKDFSLLDAIELARQSAMQEFAVAAAAAEESGGELAELAATGTDDFRAVAPPVMNFGAGRSR